MENIKAIKAGLTQAQCLLIVGDGRMTGQTKASPVAAVADRIYYRVSVEKIAAAGEDRDGGSEPKKLLCVRMAPYAVLRLFTGSWTPTPSANHKQTLAIGRDVLRKTYRQFEECAIMLKNARPRSTLCAHMALTLTLHTRLDSTRFDSIQPACLAINASGERHTRSKPLPWPLL